MNKRENKDFHFVKHFEAKIITKKTIIVAFMYTAWQFEKARFVLVKESALWLAKYSSFSLPISTSLKYHRDK